MSSSNWQTYQGQIFIFIISSGLLTNWRFAVWNFSENSSVLVPWPVPKRSFSIRSKDPAEEAHYQLRRCLWWRARTLQRTMVRRRRLRTRLIQYWVDGNSQYFAVVKVGFHKLCPSFDYHRIPKFQSVKIVFVKMLPQTACQSFPKHHFQSLSKHQQLLRRYLHQSHQPIWLNMIQSVSEWTTGQGKGKGELGSNKD